MPRAGRYAGGATGCRGAATSRPEPSLWASRDRMSFAMARINSNRCALIAVLVALTAVATVSWFRFGPDSRQVDVESEQPSSTTRVEGDAFASDATAPASVLPEERSARSGAVTHPPVIEGKKCTLQLSGAGLSNNGEQDVTNAVGYVQVTPPKLVHDEYPGERRAFWEYDGPHTYDQTPETGDAEYIEHRDSVAAFLDDRGCGPTMVVGGSNGGGFAAKLYCRGEDFGGRVWGYSLKDPVWDHGVLGCTPSSNISHKLAVRSIWLKRLAEGTAPEYRCDEISEVDVHDQFAGENGDWYCEDNRTMSQADWEAATGITSVLAGTGHIGSYDLEPELADWTIQGVWWCDWMRDNGQSTGSDCDWTWNHKWHSMG